MGLVHGSYHRRNRIHRHGISPQIPYTHFHDTILILTADTVFSTARRYARHIIFGHILYRTPAQADTQIAGTVHRNTGIVQLIGESDVATISPHGVVQQDVIVEHSFRDNQLQPRLLQIVHLVPFEGVFLTMFHRSNYRLLSLHCEADLGDISQRISQRIDKPVRAFFVDVHQSAIAVGCLQHAKAVARLYERLHVLTVCPRIDIAVLLIGKAVYRTAEDFLAVHFENHRLHAIFILHSVHIIVGTDASTNQSPGDNGFRRMCRKSPSRLLAFHHSFSRLRKQHDTFGTRGSLVLHLVHEERQRVYIFVRSRLYHIQMQVRTERVSGVSAQSYYLTGLHGIFVGVGSNFHLPTFFLVLQVFNPAGHIAHKGTQMAVYRRITIVISHIENIARTVGNADTRNISVGQSAYRLAYGSTGLEIQSAMKMVGTYLAEVTGEGDGEIKRRGEGGLVCIGFLGIAALHTTNKEQKREKYRIFHILYSQYYFKCMQI